MQQSFKNTENLGSINQTLKMTLQTCLALIYGNNMKYIL